MGISNVLIPMMDFKVTFMGCIFHYGSQIITFMGINYIVISIMGSKLIRLWE